jgi:phosphoglycolate phosphatase-like HAD superfamily hydrolase
MAAGAGERLLLFDIDGTVLLRATDAHRDALFTALREVHGLHDPGAARAIDPAGRTDGEIARAILLAHDVPAGRIDDCAGDVREACCRLFAQLCPKDLSATVAPGMREALEALGTRDDVRLGLLTGNFEPVARMKLARASLGGFFPRGQGAYGSDGEDRAGLPAIARRRAGGDGVPFARERTVIIGDTPLDIACARADGVRCVAVASGRFGREELAGADAVVGDAHGLVGALDSL